MKYSCAARKHPVRLAPRQCPNGKTTTDKNLAVTPTGLAQRISTGPDALGNRDQTEKSIGFITEHAR